MIRKSLLMLIAVLMCNFGMAAQEVIKILAIGNSFSEDAVEQYFTDICNSEGIKVVVGNLYIGGCSLDRHYENAVTNAAEYRYRKIEPNGRMTETDRCTLAKALRDESWDYISFQQASHFSGIYSTYSKLPLLIDYVRSIVGQKPTFMWHMTWAYAINSTHSGFASYNHNQLQMYHDIVGTCQRILRENPQLKILIPTGTAIQDARTAILAGDDLTRDGYHLDLKVGRYIASLTWCSAIFRRIISPASVFCPAGISEAERNAAVNAAHEAVMHPWNITALNPVVTSHTP